MKLERKLGTRLDKMLETIRAGTNQSEFVRIMRDYKVSSTAAVTTGHPRYGYLDSYIVSSTSRNFGLIYVIMS